MTPLRLVATAINPACAELAARGVVDSVAARRFLLAIALQETRLLNRRQVSSDGHEDGPASSFWQFERGGGCRGVLRHRTTAPHIRAICEAFNVEPTELALWETMRYQDIVAAAAARLLVLTLPGALPVTAEQGWAQYLNAWRPGKPHPRRGWATGPWRARPWARLCELMGVGGRSRQLCGRVLTTVFVFPRMHNNGASAYRQPPKSK